ncbi:2Fe-2S ferredoxin [Sphingobium wenxiniae]|uniref:2Fe-2S ferredoxin-type domain-containing protein n=2 Tax=Sphingobium TaxID=165695 RepID=T0G4D7_9SPHN|nr:MULTISPECIES: 2Fe-2S iron-sulfur cluster-binding protein [Sphingobium]EQA98550.1 hypothetical protein L485_17860 [Sphingobium baderi LL03]KMS61632.1 hypothetical protein V475_12585 [Sphingobium baderi LL03]MBB6193265.1 2Fe-2S ferredoxin [Sphingobium wenxiniae]TWH91418.1 2Fe-2S ferredoxin [Sphingobium wenxiniae]WRD75384.1 2Fe-2S iron-sulfur cluster-binding protein [Sphingobium baderi]
MKVTFEFSDSPEVVAEVNAGESLMRVALDHGIPGIYGDCGGQCACATCHIYIDAAWIDRIGTPEPGSTEEALLEGAPADVESNSRLACQVVLTDDLNGLVVRVPEGQ